MAEEGLEQVEDEDEICQKFERHRKHSFLYELVLLKGGRRCTGKSAEQVGELGNERDADKGNTAARDELFYPQLGVKLCSMAGGGVQKSIWCF